MENKLIDDCMKLGFGMMRLPRVEGTNTIDLEHTKRMVDAFIKAGGKYFDTAYIYEGSEEATKAALCDRYPRRAITWLTSSTAQTSLPRARRKRRTRFA